MVNIVSDRREAFRAKMKMEIMDFSGKVLWNKTVPVSMGANTSTAFFKTTTKELVNNLDTTKIVFSVKLLQGNKLLASNLCYFSSPKDLKLPIPTIKKDIILTDQGYTITLTSDKLVKDLYLDTDEKGWFSDNYFDMIPGEKVTVSFKTKEKQRISVIGLKLHSLTDSY